MSLSPEKEQQLFHNLTHNGFEKLNRNDVSGDTAATFTKIALPVLYVITFLYNMQQPDFFTKESAMTTYFENNLKQYHCNHMVHVCVLITEKDAPPDETELFPYIPGETTLHVTWQFNPANGRVAIAKGQPDKILNLKQILQHYTDIKAPDKTAAKRSDAYIKRKPLVTYGLILINLLLYLYSSFQNEEFLYLFSSNRHQIWVNKEYYRLITSMFFHDGLQHIAYNALSLYVFGSRSEKFLGHIPFFVLYILSGLGGCLCSLYFQPDNIYSLGASGAICGLVTIFFLITVTQKHIAFDMDAMTIVIYIVITIGAGFIMPNVDYYGHLGGFVTGFLLGLLYLVAPKKKNRKQT